MRYPQLLNQNMHVLSSEDQKMVKSRNRKMLLGRIVGISLGFGMIKYIKSAGPIIFGLPVQYIRYGTFAAVVGMLITMTIFDEALYKRMDKKYFKHFPDHAIAIHETSGKPGKILNSLN